MNNNKRKFQIVSILLSFCLAFSLVCSGTVVSNAASGKKAKYIAHRGWSTRAPENSLAAFALAAGNSRFYGVEFDVWESATEPSTKDITETVIDEEGNEITQTRTVPNDPLLLVMHDASTGRMCGANANIQSINRASLNNYNITGGKNAGWYPGQKIPTVEQALDTIWRNSAGAIPVIELKHRLSPRALDYLLNCIGGHNAVIISFDYNAVSDAARMSESKGMRGNIQTMYLMSKLKKKKIKAAIRQVRAGGIDCISVKYTSVNKKMVRKFHKAGIKVCIWTVPSKKKARKYARMGVDYITANGPVW